MHMIIKIHQCKTYYRHINNKVKLTILKIQQCQTDLHAVPSSFRT